MQTISASQLANQESNYESESDHDQLDLDLLLNMENDNDGLDSLQQIYSVTISEKAIGADIPVEIQEYKTKSLFDTGTQVFCISHNCYKQFRIQQKLEYEQKLIQQMDKI